MDVTQVLLRFKNRILLWFKNMKGGPEWPCHVAPISLEPKKPLCIAKQLPNSTCLRWSCSRNPDLEIFKIVSENPDINHPEIRRKMKCVFCNYKKTYRILVGLRNSGYIVMSGSGRWSTYHAIVSLINQQPETAP